MDRSSLVRRYLELQAEAARLGIYGTPHLTRDMTNEEIVRRGLALAKGVSKAKK